MWSKKVLRPRFETKDSRHAGKGPIWSKKILQTTIGDQRLQTTQGRVPYGLKKGLQTTVWDQRPHTRWERLHMLWRKVLRPPYKTKRPHTRWEKVPSGLRTLEDIGNYRWQCLCRQPVLFHSLGVEMKRWQNAGVVGFWCYLSWTCCRREGFSLCVFISFAFRVSSVLFMLSPLSFTGHWFYFL